jgi:F-type H+-transporting ATPase subunit gamma
MTTRLADIAAHIDNVRQLNAVVTAMRGIAASRAQQSRALLKAIESYLAIVARGIGESLLLAPRDWDRPAPAVAGGRKVLILFCAEGGFCGALSDRVLDAVRGELKTCTVFEIGTRGSTIAEERGIKLDWTAAMANQIGAVPSVAERVAAALYAGIAAGDFLAADVVHARPGGGIQRLSLLPVDVGQFRLKEKAQVPLVNLPFEILIEQMAAEYVYALLCSAAMHAFEAENEARMAAMVAAHAHIDDTLKTLVTREHQARQEEITSEIVELSATVLR